MNLPKKGAKRLQQGGILMDNYSKKGGREDLPLTQIAKEIWRALEDEFKTQLPETSFRMLYASALEELLEEARQGRKPGRVSDLEAERQSMFLPLYQRCYLLMQDK